MVVSDLGCFRPLPASILLRLTHVGVTVLGLASTFLRRVSCIPHSLVPELSSSSCLDKHSESTLIPSASQRDGPWPTTTLQNHTYSTGSVVWFRETTDSALPTTAQLNRTLIQYIPENLTQLRVIHYAQTHTQTGAHTLNISISAKFSRHD